MTSTRGSEVLRTRWTWGLLVFGVAVVVLSTQVHGADLVEKEKFRLSWDTTLSWGVSFRMEDPDPRIVGVPNDSFVSGASAYSVNGDDGNLNYDKGVISNTPKVITEIEFNYDERFGGFFRGRAFYDIINRDRDRERTPLTDGALGRVGSRADLLDAYLWFRFRLGARPAEIRVGEQVLSWGESTFIQGGINAINPVDVAAIRVPGAELRGALLPEGIASFSVGTTANTNLELFYQYDWDDTEIDPPGSYFSTNDFAGDGGEVVFLGFGSTPDIPPFSDPTDPSRPFLGVSRGLDVEPEEGGQYGAAFRWFVPSWGDTEFGLYYINYHSRVPTINGITGTVSGAVTAGTIGAAAPAIIGTVIGYLFANPGDVLGAIAAGTTAGVGAGAPLGASQTIAGATALAFVQSGGNVAVAQAAGGQAATAFATDAYSQTARYFLEWPEDIQLMGLSFNTQIGTTGIALQGELSHRLDAPLQVDDVELLFAALSPISPVLAGTSGIPGEPGASQLPIFRGEDYSTQFETAIPGFILRDVSQVQMTATKIFGPSLGAEQAVLVWEGAVTHVHDMPDKSELRLEGPGTYTSGNPYHADVANPGASHAGKPAEPSSAFADQTSWGYRLAGRLDYNRAIGSINLIPRFSFQHDVSGNSPGPGGNFIDGRQALTVGLTAEYQNSWSADISYTRYHGAGRYNLINDRDFLAVNAKYSF
jgi:hypothetical protein